MIGSSRTGLAFLVAALIASEPAIFSTLRSEPGESGIEREHLVTHGKHMRVHAGDYVKAGEALVKRVLVALDLPQARRYNLLGGLALVVQRADEHRAGEGIGGA